MQYAILCFVSSALSCYSLVHLKLFKLCIAVDLQIKYVKCKYSLLWYLHKLHNRSCATHHVVLALKKADVGQITDPFIQESQSIAIILSAFDKSLVQLDKIELF